MAIIQTGPSTQMDGYLVPQMPSYAFNVAKTDVDILDGGVHLYVGTGGDVRVTPERNPDTPVTFKNVPNGFILPVKILQVWSTGTTANDFIGIE